MNFENLKIFAPSVVFIVEYIEITIYNGLLNPDVVSYCRCSMKHISNFVG